MIDAWGAQYERLCCHCWLDGFLIKMRKFNSRSGMKYAIVSWNTFCAKSCRNKSAFIKDRRKIDEFLKARWNGARRLWKLFIEDRVSICRCCFSLSFNLCKSNYFQISIVHKSGEILVVKRCGSCLLKEWSLIITVDWPAIANVDKQASIITH